MLSVVVPVMNEAENIKPLVREIMAVPAEVPLTDIVYVDDGSDDSTPQVLAAVAAENPIFRYVTHKQRAGQSAAIWTGVYHAKGDLIVTLDGDGQNNPADIVLVYREWLAAQQAQGAHPLMVAGQRAKRQDNWLRRMSSIGANKIRSTILRDGVRDTGCALKLFPREDFLRLPRFNHMHRYLAALFRRDGVAIKLVDVSHRPRVAGVSKYGFWNRALVGITDLAGMAWLLARPLPPASNVT